MTKSKKQIEREQMEMITDKYVKEYQSIITLDKLKAIGNLKLKDLINKIYAEGYGDGYCVGFADKK